jgi:hypothetical protein
VAPINGCDAPDAHPLGGRDHGRVPDAELKIGVPDKDSHTHYVLL